MERAVQQGRGGREDRGQAADSAIFDAGRRQIATKVDVLWPVLAVAELLALRAGRW